MPADQIWAVGGAQGEGIDSTGDILTATLNRLGHFTFSYRHFMSLIKGGHTHYKVRVAPAPVRYQGDRVDLLVAFDQETVDHLGPQLGEGALVAFDSSRIAAAALPGAAAATACGVPMSEIARALGNVITKNMVAVGVSAAVFGLDPAALEAMVAERFGKKGGAVVELNRQAIRQGWRYWREHFPAHTLDLPPANGCDLLLLSGNEACALGALLGGCRFLAAYPITPATEIMYWALANFPRYGGKVVQAEDEIAALQMAIGAGYAGVRALTSTSGPGFSLMQEGLGLAGITETPVVIINVMRGGPATGLPTKPEQSDLNLAVWGSHGDCPRIVIAPTTVEECCHFTAEAFNLAERFQVPVLVLSDLFLGLNKASVPGLDLVGYQIDRGQLVGQAFLNSLEPGEFRRYLDTDGGVSPRSVPGQRNGRFVALSNEHDPAGSVEIEDPQTRVAQMEKRWRKLSALDPDDWGGDYDGPAAADLVLVGFGSTRAQIAEAVAELRRRGLLVGHLQLRLLRPFPAGLVGRHLGAAARALVVEHNIGQQLGRLIRAEVGGHERLIPCLKFSGDPFTVAELVDRALEVVPVAQR